MNRIVIALLKPFSFIPAILMMSMIFSMISRLNMRASTLLSLPAPDEALPPHVPNRSTKTSRTFPPKHTGSLTRSL